MGKQVIRASGMVALFLMVSRASVTGKTFVTLTFRGSDGELVRITRAQLLVTAWGVSERYELPTEGNVVRFDLDARKPEWADGFAETQGFLYVAADGYPRLLSNAFVWPTERSGTVAIDFRNGRSLMVPYDGETSGEIRLRRPQPKRIHLVDGAGQPVAGMKMEVAVNWPAPNHCGFLNGRDVLAMATTDEQGTLRVPDADAQYALTLGERRVAFEGGNGDGQLVVSLTQTDTTLRVHRYQRQRLIVDILRDGKPAVGAELWSDMGLGVCGAGSGTLGISDSRGRVNVPDFYPEEWRSFWVCYAGEDAWESMDGARLPSRIDLAPEARPERSGFAAWCTR